MLKAKIFHAAFEAEPVLVAELALRAKTEDAALSEAFERTNSIDGPWYEAEGVPGARSTSAGDYVVLNDGQQESIWRCAFVGWKRVTEMVGGRSPDRKHLSGFGL
jgi:hypothetical protein